MNGFRRGVTLFAITALVLVSACYGNPKAVVRIGGCSGVCVSPDGLVLTAKHCEVPEKADIEFPGHPTVVGTRVYVGPQGDDVVAYDVPGDGWDFMPVAEAVPDTGASVWSGGYPAPSREYASAKGTLRGGGEFERFRIRQPGVGVRDIVVRVGERPVDPIIRAFGKFQANDTDFHTGGGWSGGPLVDEHGHVIGLLSSGDEETSTFISWAATRKAVDSLREVAQFAPKRKATVFTRANCPACVALKRSYQRGAFSEWEFEFVDLDDDAGLKRFWKEFKDVNAARKAKGLSQYPRKLTLPVLHPEDKAVLYYGSHDEREWQGILKEAVDFFVRLLLGDPLPPSYVEVPETGAAVDDGGDAPPYDESQDSLEDRLSRAEELLQKVNAALGVVSATLKTAGVESEKVDAVNEKVDEFLATVEAIKAAKSTDDPDDWVPWWVPLLASVTGLGQTWLGQKLKGMAA